MFNTPVLLIIFNRPQTTLQVFDVIRKNQPKQLFVAADGPREGKEGEEELCQEARRISTSMDWDGEVHTLFRDKNLGCGLGPSSAITWFFENVEEGIILEDDCIPSVSFFQFCATLLEHYRNVPKVMHISGNNFQDGRRRGSASYYFSRFTHNTGWATWRRAWKYYDFELTPLEERMHAWDAQWKMSVDAQHGVAILPNVNLVKNIGFGPDATHTKELSQLAFLAAEEITFPLVHPGKVQIDRDADRFTEYRHFRNVKNPVLIWLYEMRDLGIKTAKRIKNTLWNSRRSVPSMPDEAPNEQQ